MATQKIGPRRRKRTSCKDLVKDAKALQKPLRAAREALSACQRKNFKGYDREGKATVEDACASEKTVVNLQKQIIVNAIKKADAKCEKYGSDSIDLDLIAASLY